MERFAPIWVTHPSSGKEIDVAPLLFWLEQFDAAPDQQPGEGALQAVRRIGRAMNFAKHNPDLTTAEQVVDLYVDVHRLEDMFSDIPIRPISSTTSVVKTAET